MKQLGSRQYRITDTLRVGAATVAHVRRLDDNGHGGQVAVLSGPEEVVAGAILLGFDPVLRYVEPGTGVYRSYVWQEDRYVAVDACDPAVPAEATRGGQVLALVAQERQRQRFIWSEEHDRQHAPTDWTLMAQHYLGRASMAAVEGRMWEGRRDDSDAWARWQDGLVKAAAIILAGLEHMGALPQGAATSGLMVDGEFAAGGTARHKEFLRATHATLGHSAVPRRDPRLAVTAIGLKGDEFATVRYRRLGDQTNTEGIFRVPKARLMAPDLARPDIQHVLMVGDRLLASNDLGDADLGGATQLEVLPRHPDLLPPTLRTIGEAYWDNYGVSPTRTAPLFTIALDTQQVV